MTLHHGDCLEVMATFDAESVDAIVTDPPYGLGFMGKTWDSPDGPGGLGDVPMRRRSEMNKVNTGVGRQGGRQRSTVDFARRQARDARDYQAWCETWAVEAHRVSKPGAHLLAFGGTRTYHRLACAIEDAGWEIRDTLVWAYASGFPKSLNPGRANDASACQSNGTHVSDPEHACPMISPPEMYGLGTALKPAWEPIVMARKPLRGTVVGNWIEHGTGALNIDATRIGSEAMPSVPGELGRHSVYGRMPRGRTGEPSASRRYADEPGDFAALPGPRGGDVRGRWPANVILTDPIFDGDTPGVVGGGRADSVDAKAYGAAEGKYQTATPFGPAGFASTYGDSGTYSRFFLIPKAARSDREPVMGGVELRTHPGWSSGEQSPGTFQSRPTPARANVHPTVKPTELMRHLVRLVTPPGGLVLDPFLGSGTTALAAEMEGFRWVGIEREAEYVAIAEARLNGTQRGLGLVG